MFYSEAKAAQPKLQRAWLRQGGKRREMPILVPIQAASEAKIAKPLKKPLFTTWSLIRRRPGILRYPISSGGEIRS